MRATRAVGHEHGALGSATGTIVALALAVVAAPGCSAEPASPAAGGGDGVSFAEVAGDGSDALPTGDQASGPDAVAPDTGPVTPLCTSDEACTEAGAVCACTGQCVVPAGNACASSKNCPPGNWCDPCVGHCAPRAGLCEACTDSGACTDGGACLPFASGGTFCVEACVTDAGCPAGYACVEVASAADKQCVPKSGDCEDLGLCADDGECPMGEICSDTLKVCAPGCPDDDACPSGMVCVAARCVQPCASTADCTAPAECDTTGHCKIPGSCESSADCTQPETYCDKTTGMCADGCIQDDDCKDAAMECKNKSCVPKGCTHNYQCAFEQECDKTTGQCIPMTRDHCATCDADADNQCGGDPNLCVTMSSEDKDTGESVEQGDFCLLTCAEDEVDKCPQGYGCTHIENADAGIDGFYCTRACWEQPVGAPAQ